MTQRVRIRVVAVGLASAGLVAFAGCRDEIAAPTMGFIEIDTGGVEGVEVFVDGESLGTLTGAPVGPVDEGDHSVAVARECYESVLGEQAVTVRPAETSALEFVLVPREFGSVAITTSDELREFEVTGAQILREVGGEFTNTGLTTPATIDDLPCGNETFLIRMNGYPDRPITVAVDTGVLTEVHAELGPRRKVLAEMFTYQTCPNCPESSDALKEIREDDPDRFFVIEWHTWDFTHFNLFDPRWKAREEAYTGGIPLSYPGVVIQGGYADDPRMLDGSRPSEPVQYRQRADYYLAECDTDCHDRAGCDECVYALIAEGSVTPGTTDLMAWLKWRGGSAPGDLKLRFVLIENEVSALGIGSPFYYVPRNYHEEAVSFTSPGEILEIHTSLSVDPSWDVSHMGYVVYLQSDATLEVLAIDGT
jgi:hypothetical protein